MSRMTFMQAFVATALIGMAGWIVFAVVEGNYLEAVAIGSIGSVLAWFALGAGGAPKDDERE